jgi:hypothetical protein
LLKIELDFFFRGCISGSSSSIARFLLLIVFEVDGSVDGTGDGTAVFFEFVVVFLRDKVYFDKVAALVVYFAD